MIDEKESIRLGIWDSLRDKKISEKSPYGRIPDFKGSNLAAELLISTPEWKGAETIFSSPDFAQIKVREHALKDGKHLIMASPKLKKGYILINPETVKGKENEAATIEGAFKLGESMIEFPKVDMVIEGSVAIDMNGNRLGKGGGYADREIERLFSEKSINENTPVVTTIHEIQIVQKVPSRHHDKKINMIVTPERVIRL